MIATLPMYDMPELRGATNAWWTGLAGHLRAHGIEDVPVKLTRDYASREQHWLSSDLLVSQTCAYPLVHVLSGKVKLVATPRHDAPGFAGSSYCSLIVTREQAEQSKISDFDHPTVAINGYDSHSGWNALRLLVEKSGSWDEIFGKTIVSGSHAASIDLLRNGTADIAAIDCVTHALLGDTDPGRLDGIKVIDQTASAPSLPYITRGDISNDKLEAIISALNDAVNDPILAAARRCLRIKGFEEVPLGAYEDAMGRAD